MILTRRLLANDWLELVLVKLHPSKIENSLRNASPAPISMSENFRLETVKLVAVVCFVPGRPLQSRSEEAFDELEVVEDMIDLLKERHYNKAIGVQFLFNKAEKSFEYV